MTHQGDGISQQISFIHALTRHLLHIPDADAQHILIAVLPRWDGWKVRVSYAGFYLETECPHLSDALKQLVQDLTARVSTQLEEGTKLLGRNDHST